MGLRYPGTRTEAVGGSSCLDIAASTACAGVHGFDGAVSWSGVTALGTSTASSVCAGAHGQDDAISWAGFTASGMEGAIDAKTLEKRSTRAPLPPEPPESGPFCEGHKEDRGYCCVTSREDLVKLATNLLAAGLSEDEARRALDQAYLYSEEKDLGASE